MTAHSQLNEPLVPQRRSEQVRKLLRRMAEKQDQTRGPLRPHARKAQHSHVRKRKAALAFSAGVMGMSSAAMAAPATMLVR
jgi:hypothetical protein